MPKHPRVAIIVLNYNGEECLPRCLTALQGLQYSQHHVVVVDNGSQDHSFAQAQADFPAYTYISKESNSGFAAGMNTGIAYAKRAGFDFVWLLNYDAEVSPDTLDRLMEAHHKDPAREALSPVIRDAQGNVWFAGGRVNYFRMRTEHRTEIPQNTPYVTGFLTGCAPLLSVRLLEKVGNFDERFFLYYEDADLSLRIQKAGHQLFVVPGAEITHSEESVHNAKKLYYLVHYGLLFFALHTPKHLRAYIAGYVTIRRLVNRIKLLLGLPGARLVASAYADYFRKFQAGDQLYLRKLS